MNALPVLKPEEEFTNGMVDIGNRMFWFLMSDDITGELARRKAMREKEALHGRPEKEAV